MLYVWLAILVLLNAVWWGMVFFGLPGNWLMVIGTSLFAWWQWEQRPFAVGTLVVISVLAIVGELVEFFAGMTGAKKGGAGFRGSVGVIGGAVLGAVIGTMVMPVPILGTIIGSCIGAGLGAWGMEASTGKDTRQLKRIGMGASVGQLVGLLTKLSLGLLIWLVIAVAAFWP
jgi:hypothetical protein